MAITAALVVTLSAVMLSVLRVQLTDNLEEGLAQRADTIEAVVRDGQVGTGQGGTLRTDEDLLVQVLDPGGNVLMSSNNLEGAPAIVAPVAATTTGVTVADRPETFRVLSRAIPSSVGDRFLVVGVNNDDVSDPLRAVAVLVGVLGPGAVVLLGGLTWWIVGRVLRPIEAMRAQMAEISATNLGGRVPEPQTGDEINRLAVTMNLALGRLDDAVRRQQRFVADASHELRGPLTRIRTELEVDLALSNGDPVGTERSVLEETISLQHLVEDLLHLARSDAGAAELVKVGVDLDDIVLREVRRLSERQRVRVDALGVSGAHVTGDPAQLGRAVRNLLDNAERHAATTVTITLTESQPNGAVGAAGVARLTVSDDGAGIPSAERKHIFERFTRLDAARSRDTGGTGLGLAITRDIIHRHGGTLDLSDGPLTTFVIELPARP
ncbi:MAG: sensor histidine kinase [Acidimicrobiales bacterium]